MSAPQTHHTSWSRERIDGAPVKNGQRAVWASDTIDPLPNTFGTVSRAGGYYDEESLEYLSFLFEPDNSDKAPCYCSCYDFEVTL